MNKEILHTSMMRHSGNKGDLEGKMGDLFYGQFVLGPSFVNPLEGWQRINIDDALKLTAHPDLNTARIVDQEKSLVLVGFMLDPRNPAAGDVDILRSLLGKFSSRAELIGATAELGGRWILIATNGKEKFLFTDALGLRQVFYTNPAGTESVWAMSQPKPVADLLGLTVDDAAHAFMNSYEFRVHPEYKWIGTATPYREIKHLFPNHCLDLRTGMCNRYWPDQRLELLDLDEAVEKIAALLQGLLTAAAARFDLAIPVTAGLDSRLVLAASRQVRNDVSYMTVRQAQSPDDCADVVVPARLLKKLGLDHHIVRAQVTTTPEFSKKFKQNVYLAHDHYGPDAEAILGYFSRQKVAVTGSGAEVGRRFLSSKVFDRMERTPQLLAAFQDLSGNDFAIRQCRDWLGDVGQIRDLNFEVLDLFEWEDGCNWLAMTQLEFDIAWRDIFTPYNCRQVLALMLSVDKKYRESPDFELFARLIARLWPEVLSEPINPHQKKSTLGRFKGKAKFLVKHLLHRI